MDLTVCGRTTFNDPAMTLQLRIMLMARSVLSKRSSASAASMLSLRMSVGVEDC